jgi:hypothetical protein
MPQAVSDNVQRYGMNKWLVNTELERIWTGQVMT